MSDFSAVNNGLVDEELRGRVEGAKESSRSQKDYISSLYKSVFGTPQGQQLLNHMKEKYLESPVTPGQIGMGVDGVMLSMFQNVREGENNVVREIMRQLKK